jgi:hypothetical protein
MQQRWEEDPFFTMNDFDYGDFYGVMVNPGFLHQDF